MTSNNIFIALLFFLKAFSVQASAASNPETAEEHPYYSFGIISNELGGGDLVSQFMLPNIMEEELEKAEKGDAKSQYIVATMYGKGVGFEKNLKIAKKWHSKAIEQGFTYDPFDLNNITKRLKNSKKLKVSQSRMSIKGFKIGQKKGEVIGRWSELSVKPLACESIGADKDGYPWEKCIYGVNNFKIDWFPLDGSEPVVPKIKTPEDELLTVGLIPLQRVEFNFRGDTLVDMAFKLVDSRTLYDPNWNHVAYKYTFDSCPKVDLCAQYKRQFSKIKGIKVKFDTESQPSQPYEKCGDKNIRWMTNQEDMTCFGAAHDTWGRDDLLLYSKPRFKEPGTITLKEYNELLKEERKKEEKQKMDDL